MSSRMQRVRLETGRHVIEGDVQMPVKGFRSRVTDFFNANATEFIALTDVIVTPLDGSTEGVNHDFLAVSARHVVLVIELDGEPAPG